MKSLSDVVNDGEDCSGVISSTPVTEFSRKVDICIIHVINFIGPCNAKFFLHYTKIITRYDVITYSIHRAKNHAVPDVEYTYKSIRIQWSPKLSLCAST